MSTNSFFFHGLKKYHNRHFKFLNLDFFFRLSQDFKCIIYNFDIFAADFVFYELSLIQYYNLKVFLADVQAFRGILNLSIISSLWTLSVTEGLNSDTTGF